MQERTRQLLLLAALICAAAIAPAPAGAKAPGVNGPIAFDRDDPASAGDSFVFSALADGTGLVQVVPTHSCCAHFSPDGRLIAAAASAPDGRVTTATVRPDASGYSVHLPPDPTFNVACGPWSPSGARLACEVWDDVHPDRTPGIFSVRSSDFGGLERLTANPYGGHDLPGDYSPDGRRFVFWREDPALGNDRLAMYVLTLADGSTQRISGWQQDFGGASWSPDGRWIVTDNARGGIYALHPDGSGRHEIPVGAGRFSYAFEPSWSPDGKQIIFSMVTADRPRNGSEAIYTMNADGSGLRSTGLGGDSADWGAASGRVAHGVAEALPPEGFRVLNAAAPTSRSSRRPA